MDNETREEWRAFASELFANPDPTTSPDRTSSEGLYVRNEGRSAPPPRNGDHNFVERLFW
jgi:hypothetical protein